MKRLLLCGDMHLSSKNRGGHKDYPSESLFYYNYITDLIKQYNCDYSIDLGDLTYGRFNTLEYRLQVEEAFSKRKEAVNGNYYVLKGNHDEATYGLTEYEFYLDRYFHGSTNLLIDNLNLVMVDFGKEQETEPTFLDNKTNIILAHNYFKFESSILPNFGTPILLDMFSNWYGADYIISGHIHSELIQKGNIKKTDTVTGVTHGKECIVHNLPCLARTDYSKNLPDKGSVVLLDVYDDKVEYQRVEVDLLPVEECFNIENILEKKDTANETVDIRDIITELNKFELVLESPEVKISSLNVEQRYKDKALELYKNATESK